MHDAALRQRDLADDDAGPHTELLQLVGERLDQLDEELVLASREDERELGCSAAPLGHRQLFKARSRAPSWRSGLVSFQLEDCTSTE